MDSKERELLAEGLKSTDYATRLVATEALACLDDAWAVQGLEHQLGDPEEDVRAAAIVSLGRQRGDAARKLLFSIRDDKTEQLALRVLAVRSLHNPETCPRR